MKTVPLGEVVELRAGMGFPPALQGRATGDFPFAKVGDISRHGRNGKQVIDTADNYVSHSDLNSLRAKPVAPGSTLFAKIGEAIRQNHRVVAGTPMLIDNNAMAATPGAEVDAGYLFRFLQSVDLYQHASATTVPSLRKSDLERVEMPLPSLDEQRRIAAILDRADKLRAKQRQIVAEFDELTQATFTDMFGDPVSNAHGLPVGTIKDLIKSADYGTSEKSSPQGGIAVLRMNNITYSGAIDPKDLKYMDLPPDKHGRYTVSTGDVLFNRTNSAELVGKTAVYHGEAPLAYAGYLVRLRVREGFSPDYLSGVLNSRYGKATLRGMCKSIVGMANINAKEVQTIRTLIPPAFEQSKYSAAMEAIRKEQQRHKGVLAALDELFVSLQSRAFRGEL